MLEPTGQLLGPFPEAVYKVDNTHLGKGDVVVLYTDGVSEARGGTEMYGESRLEEKVRELSPLSAKEICQHLLDDVLRFSSASELADDKTIVVIKRVS
jgi:sigma-B regulation protein RsbU (phosphoserine phosphatase)